jgi:hypothetical protein
LDRLVVLAETYADAKAHERRLRAAMRALRCTVQYGPCYQLWPGIAPNDALPEKDCAACAERRIHYVQYLKVRATIRLILRRIEALVAKSRRPVPPEPEEPKPLLDLLVSQEGPTDQEESMHVTK